MDDGSSPATLHLRQIQPRRVEEPWLPYLVWVVAYLGPVIQSVQWIYANHNRVRSLIAASRHPLTSQTAISRSVAPVSTLEFLRPYL
jgi:hypothetical protein